MKRKSEKTKIQNSSKRIIILRIVLLILIFIWAYVIFNISNQDGDESSGFSKMFVKLSLKSL